MGEDNEKILVDTGFLADYIPGIDSTFSRQPHEELVNALLEPNISYQDEIKAIIFFTHLHWDHTGGIDLFSLLPHFTFSPAISQALISLVLMKNVRFNTSRMDKFLLR